MPTDLLKTLTYLALHLTVAFTVGYVLTGSVAIAGGFALIEPLCNAIAFFFHEKAWNGRLRLFGWRIGPRLVS
ncbi:MAG: DUF2061 domain-containing protein [Allosphingosinicella sp.]